MNVMYFIIPKCDVAFVYDDFNVRQVLEKIEYYKYSAMPVIDRSGHYVGTITEGDLLTKIKEEYTLNIRDAEKDFKCTNMHFLSDKGAAVAHCVCGYVIRK